MTPIPLVCLSFNQPTFLQNLINHWRFYHPNEETHPIYIFDNGSTNSDLLYLLTDYHNTTDDIRPYQYTDNNFIPNLTHFLNTVIKPKYEYYVLSDCDILPHPSTPWNYLDVFRHLIDSGYHRAGFGLIIDDLSPNLHLRANIIHDEKENLKSPISFEFEGKTYEGFKAPTDTTFTMFTTKNTGWYAPMNGKDWGNSVRVFKSFHCPWHLDEDRLNPEMVYYYEQAKPHVPGQPSAGASTRRPKKYSPPI
jgi:hypothetical protein